MRAQSGESRPALLRLALVLRLATMRRLHQVLLAAVAVASLLGFLLYKHEYDRLSSLLHVLNTFGAASTGPRRCDPGDVHRQPPSSGVWQQVENVYVYAAFLEAGTAAVTGVVPSSIAARDVGVSRCLFWYETEGRQYADLTVSFADEEPRDSPPESWRMVSLSCALPLTNGGRPYAVSLLSSTPPEAGEDSLPQIPLQEAASNASLAVCAALRSPQTDPVLLAQFVKFHRHVGASSFTFYDLGLSPAVQARLRALAAELTDVDLRLQTWNFPFEFADAAAAPPGALALRRDCLARHAGASYVLFAPLATLVVPVYHSHVTSLLRDEDSVGGRRLGQLRLRERVFCTELESSPYTRSMGADMWPMYLKTAWVEATGPGPQDFFLVKPAAVGAVAAAGPKLKEDFEARSVGEDVAVVHSYRSCGPNPAAAPRFDNSMMQRFLTQIQ